MKNFIILAGASWLVAGCAPKAEKVALKEGTPAFTLAKDLAAVMPALAPDKTTVLVEAKGVTITAAEVIQAIQDNLGTRTAQLKGIDAGQLKNIIEQGAIQLAERKLLLAAAKAQDGRPGRGSRERHAGRIRPGRRRTGFSRGAQEGRKSRSTTSRRASGKPCSSTSTSKASPRPGPRSPRRTSARPTRRRRRRQDRVRAPHPPHDPGQDRPGKGRGRGKRSRTFWRRPRRARISPRWPSSTPKTPAPRKTAASTRTSPAVRWSSRSKTPPSRSPWAS